MNHCNAFKDRRHSASQSHFTLPYRPLLSGLGECNRFKNCLLSRAPNPELAGKSKRWVSRSITIDRDPYFCQGIEGGDRELDVMHEHGFRNLEFEVFRIESGAFHDVRNGRNQAGSVEFPGTNPATSAVSGKSD